MTKSIDVSSREMELLNSACGVDVLPTAQKFLGEDPRRKGWYLFELVPTPELMGHMSVNGDTCRNMVTEWDRVSNYCHLFSAGDCYQLMVPAAVMKTVMAYFCGPSL